MRLTELVDAAHAHAKGGNCIPGPYLPFGMAMPSPDAPGDNSPHGYDPGKGVSRFSANHVNGTGGNGRYGNCSIVPFLNKPDLSHPAWPIREEQASVGHYSCSLGDSGIHHELTASHQVAMHRTRFPDTEHGLLFDTGSHITRGDLIKPVAGLIEWIGDTEIQGWTIIKGGWGHEFPYQIHFFVRFSRPAIRRKCVQNGELTDTHWADGPGPMTAAWFEENSVETRIGISHVSIANARRAVDRTQDVSFDEMVQHCRDAWDRELSVIQGDGETGLRREIASSLYRLFSMPTDLGTDENPWWHSQTRNFTDYYCLWDSVRNANSLLMLIRPQLQAAMIQDLIDIGLHRGWLPDAWIAGHSAHVQGGISASIIIAEAAAKGLEGIDYQAALDQLLHDSETRSPDEHLCGRYAEEWQTRGWLPADIFQSLSRSIEYSYQDYCIAQLAEHLGNKPVSERYYKQSQTLWELWNDEHRCFTPKTRDGSFLPGYDSWKPTRPDFWYDPYCYEGTAQEYSLTPLHLIQDIIKRHGGPEEFCDHLDQVLLHKRYSWKEFMLHLPWLPYEAGLPERSVPLLQEMRKPYHTGPSGIPDNEDFGAQSTFAIGTITGLYPVMGQDRYWISSPLLHESRWQLPGGELTVRCPQADGTIQQIKNITLNGQQTEHPWVYHRDIVNGAEITIELVL